jgi:hypothetical protein
MTIFVTKLKLKPCWSKIEVYIKYNISINFGIKDQTSLVFTFVIVGLIPIMLQCVEISIWDQTKLVLRFGHHGWYSYHATFVGLKLA